MANRSRSPQISRLVLGTHDGEQYDISELISTCNIFLDMFLPYTTMTISLYDTTSVIEQLRLTGGEYIDLEFRSLPINSFIPFKKRFYIYSIQNLQEAENGGEAYVFNCMTLLGQKNLSTNIRTGFINMTEENIVKTILTSLNISSNNYSLGEDYVRFRDYPLQPLVSTPSLFSERHIIQNWRLDETLAYITKHAASPENSKCDFFFFEGHNAYKFYSISDMVKQTQREAMYQFKYTLKNTSEEAIETTDTFSIKDYEIVNMFDTILNTEYNLNEVNIKAIDTVNKVFGTVNHNYADTVDNYYLPDTRSGGLRPLGRNNKTLFVNPFYPSRLQQNFTEQRDTVIGMYNNNKVYFDMYGVSFIDVGVLADIQFPSYDKSSTNKDSALFSGKALITRVKHSLTQNSHNMVVETRKPAYRFMER